MTPSRFPITEIDVNMLANQISNALRRYFRLSKDQCDEIAHDSAVKLLIDAHMNPGKIQNTKAVAMTDAFRAASKEQKRAERMLSLNDLTFEGLLLADREPSPEKQILDKDEIDRMFQAIGRLEETDRSILILVMAGLSNKQIAHLRELDLAELGKRRTAAIRKLRRYLRDDEPDRVS